MVKAISPRRIVSKPDKRPRRALVGKHPTRTGVRLRRGRYKHNTSSVVKGLSSGCDPESQSDYDYDDKIPITNISSTRLLALYYAHLTSLKIPKSKYSGRSGILEGKGTNQQKTAMGNCESHLSARLSVNFLGDRDGKEDASPINHRYQRASQPLTFARPTGTQSDPHVIESDYESEVEDPPRPQLKASRARFASHFEHHIKEELQERYSSHRKQGQSRYCPPSSRKVGVKDVQEFIEDVVSDAESVETFHCTDTESEEEKSDLDEEEMAEELHELSITMDDWRDNKKRQRSLNTDTDIDTATEKDTNVYICPQRNFAANNTKHNQAVSSHYKRASKKSRFEFSPEPMDDDDDDDFFTLYAAKQRKEAARPQAKPASRWAQKDRTTTRNRPRAAISPSLTPSLLSLDFSLLNREVPIASVEPTDREVRLQSRKSKSVV